MGAALRLVSEWGTVSCCCNSIAVCGNAALVDTDADQGVEGIKPDTITHSVQLQRAARLGGFSGQGCGCGRGQAPRPAKERRRRESDRQLSRAALLW